MLCKGLPIAIPESQSLLSMDERVQLYLAHLWMIHVWLSIINCGEITIHRLGALTFAGLRWHSSLKAWNVNIMKP